MTAITGKQTAFGALLKCNLLAGDNSATWRNVAYVRSIGGPGLSMDVADVTTHDSTNAWEEVVATILHSGEVAVELEYDPADVTQEGTTAGLIHKMKDQTALTFKIYFYNDTVEASRTIWTLPGFVTGYEPSAPHDGALTAAMKIKINGAPTLL